MASIFDVAQEAKVSPSTVSLVLNHRHRVSPETRDRVQRIIQRLGYQSPRQRDDAKVQPTTQSRKLAFLYTLESMYDQTVSSYCREIINGIQSAVRDGGCLSILRGADHVDHDAILHQQLEAGELDGVILFGPEITNGYLERLMAAGLPLVVFNRPPAHGKYSCVTLDYYGGACQAIDHLVGLGHRNIASLLGDRSEKLLSKEIRSGAMDALNRHGLEPVFSEDFTRDLTPAHTAALCQRILKSGATALATGDFGGVRIANAMTQLGVRIPQDFSIIGFDDLGLRTAQGLQLTSIGYDKRRMGRMAVRMLQQLIQGDDTVRWMASAVSTHVVEGQTTGPLPPL
jgi:LacI family transcriptional regulator